MSLVSDIDALVEYVKKIHREWSDPAVMDELTKLDMAVYVSCARAGLLIHLPNPGPTENFYNELFGKTKIYVSTACGPNCVVHASGRWLSDMKALRMLAEDVEPAKEKLQPSFRQEVIQETISESGDCKHASDSADASAELGRFLTSELLEMTGLENTALNSYIARADVPKTERGKRNRKFTISDARKILNAIVQNSSNERDKQRVEQALKDLAEITA